MTDETRPSDYLKAWPQYLWPGHLLSRLMYAVTHTSWRAIKDPFIRWFVRTYDVDMSEADEQDPSAYPHFNAFFTRALKPGARPLPSEADALVCPVDGVVSRAGTIGEGRIFQAKGHDYDVTELLGGRTECAAPFQDGGFATLYLSPKDYHRIHMPLGGRLREMIHVPGRLFSVSPATAKTVPRLFARNERVVALFDTEAGPMALVLVAAVFVAGVETVWSGVVTPPAGRTVRCWHYDDQEITLARGEEMGRFNMGSTVIVLFGRDAVEWNGDALGHLAKVRMGQAIGRIKTPAALLGALSASRWPV